MFKNLGIFDRILRLVLGIFIIYYGLMIESFIAVIGTLLIFTAAVSSCPIYRLLKLSTCKKVK